ncbi:hypothetical protein GC018_05575 [Campylobacter hepaticus]|uniref:hypothetical protein n=1 Tax=Campylobacter hepaticus TaxID=1813019 RepID=UPI00128AEC40|nr:hypothetical protein [Campylobacter hepaticus]MPV98639.1 hypothetical protein [Campylobacter hepaticus]
MLIWQTLAIFNFMLPVQVAFEKGAMAEVGILDAVMGLGMICSSILLSKKKYGTVIHYKFSILLLLLVILF